MDTDKKITPASLSLPISQITFIVFDIETTGLNPHANAILEIGAVKIKDQRQLGTFETLINPGEGVVNTGIEINKITPEMLAGQPDIATALTDFVKFVDDGVLVGHNLRKFDLPFVRAHLARLSMPPLYNYIVDTLTLARKIFPNQSSYSLQELARTFSIPQSNAHRALDDSITCYKILRRIIDKISFMGDPPPLSKLVE